MLLEPCQARMRRKRHADDVVDGSAAMKEERKRDVEEAQDQNEVNGAAPIQPGLLVSPLITESLLDQSTITFGFGLQFDVALLPNRCEWGESPHH